MSVFESANDILERQCTEILNDQPKIDSALKNLISQVMASLQQGEAGNKLDLVNYQQVMSAARVILKEINSFSLESTSQWGVNNPQDDTPASVRLSEISMYKSAAYVYSKISSEGLKPSKCFGKKFLEATKIWPSIHQKLSSSPDASNEIFSSFLSMFNHSLSEVSRSTSIESPPHDVDIIWSTDFSGALQARQAQRVVDALKREEIYKQQLRDLMTNGEQCQQSEEEDTLPRVEYLGNADDDK